MKVKNNKMALGHFEKEAAIFTKTFATYFYITRNRLGIIFYSFIDLKLIVKLIRYPHV